MHCGYPVEAIFIRQRALAKAHFGIKNINDECIVLIYNAPHYDPLWHQSVLQKVYIFECHFAIYIFFLTRCAFLALSLPRSSRHSIAPLRKSHVCLIIFLCIAQNLGKISQEVCWDLRSSSTKRERANDWRCHKCSLFSTFSHAVEVIEIGRNIIYSNQ